MTRIKTALAYLVLIFAFQAKADEATVTFSPEPGVEVRINMEQSSIYCEVSKGDEKSITSFPLESETKRHLVVDDFNFDGKMDFSVWYIDEGMGVYAIHRVFVYSKKKTLIEKFPDCGDVFINLKVDKERKRLLSTYYKENAPRICSTRLNGSPN